MMLLSRLLVVVALGLAAGACASAQARPVASVPLDVPTPPPREPMEPSAVGDSAETAPAERPPARAGAPPAETTPGGGRQGRPAAAGTPTPPPAAPSATATPTPPSSVSPAPELRPSGERSPAISAQEVRTVIERTSRKLGALNRQSLSPGQQGDYDSARQFLAQAQAALKTNDLLLARYSADKAETLANGLR